MGANAELLRAMGPELELLLPELDEKARRLVLGAVARAAGDGGVTAVARLSGASWQTVADGAAELASGDDAGPGRVRRPGGVGELLQQRDRAVLCANGNRDGTDAKRQHGQTGALHAGKHTRAS